MKTPQQLSREAIDEFKAIYQEEFGIVLADEEIRVIATLMPQLFADLSRTVSGSNPSTEEST